MKEKTKKISLKDVIEFKKHGGDIFDDEITTQEPVYNELLLKLLARIESLIDKPILPPQISVAAPQVNVSAPNVTVSVPKADPPAVNVAAPNVTVETAPVEKTKKWKFTIIRDFRNGLIETVNAERIE